LIDLDSHNVEHNQQSEKWTFNWIGEELWIDSSIEVSEEVITSIWVLFDLEMEVNEDW